MPRPCFCDRVPNSGPFDGSRDCPLCWHWYHTPALRASWEGKTVNFGPLSVSTPRPDLISPARTRINPDRLIAEPKTGRAFNPSITRYKGRWLMAYRTGWSGSRIAVCEADPISGVPGPSVVLDLKHQRIVVGAEDPRLFVWRSRLHVAFTCYDGYRTHQLYARLTDEFRVEQVFEPKYLLRADWEKNWQFFEGLDENLYAVYSVDPHIVLRIDGEKTEAVGQTECPVQWDGGMLRGGCPPVFIDGQWWHWFHGVKDDGEPNRRYSVGLYTFEAEPPFAIRSWANTPIAWASEQDWKESGNYCRVSFPGGAVFDRGVWRVAVGVHDRWCEIWSWSHQDVRAALGMQRHRDYCFHLGKRTELREGCGGWSCEWTCDAGEPVAVPGGVCQSCEKWVAR